MKLSAEISLGYKEQRFKLFIQTLFPSLAPAIAKRSDPGVYPQIIDISFDDRKLN